MERRVRTRVVVDNRVRVERSWLGAGDEEALQRAFTHDNPKAGEGPDEPLEYRTWTWDGGEWLTFPRGGMSRVRAVLRERQMMFDVYDERTWAHPEPDFPDHLMTERPYQARMREAAEKKQNCILHGATGSGKTCVLYSLLARLKRRALVMVWTDGLLKQWRDRAMSELGMAEHEVGIIAGSKERIAPLTICMQQTIASRIERGDRSLVDQFDVLCCDEVQRMAARTCYAAVDPFRARYRVGVSADHTRHDEKEFLIRDLFGDVVAEVKEEETIAAKATVEVEVYVVPTKFRAPWFFRSRSPVRFQRLIEEMCADEERNRLGLSIAKQVVGEQGEQVLYFTARVEHARDLDSRLTAMGVRSGVLLGGKGQSLAFDRSVAGLRAGELSAGCGTYEAIGAAIDFPSISRGVCMTPVGKNRQKLGQVKGRICRASDGKGFGRLYYLLDSSIYGKGPVRNFVQWFRVVKVWDGSSWVDGKAWLAAGATVGAA